MPISLVPWEPHVFPQEIQVELRRRIKNRGFNPVDSFSTTWNHNNDDGGEWESYRGPMTSWVRVCSNGAGLEDSRPPMEGFVFYGGKDFYTSYGINQSVHKGAGWDSPNRTIIGYTPRGLPHTIDNDLLNSAFPIHAPPPEIEKITATIQKELMRRVRIEWTCFSFKQLEYMTPYFLIPGITCIIEWGWNHFNPLSLLNLDDETGLAQLYNNPYPLYTENVLGSKGNYEVVFGQVTNFEWSIDGNKIKCMTEVTSKDRIWAGQTVTSNMVLKSESSTDTQNAEPIRVVDSLKTFVMSYIDKFRDLIDLDKSSDAIIDSYLTAPSTDKEKFPLRGFIQYVKNKHPDNYKEYLFGIYYGRDEKNTEEIVTDYTVGGAGFGGTVTSTDVKRKTRVIVGADTNFDFDIKGARKHLWLNMGLVMDIISYHSSQLNGVKDQPMFSIDVDDCIISAHPNLISTNGNALLIPNAIAPKYFSGNYGYAKNPKESSEYSDVMSPCTQNYPWPKRPDPKDTGGSLLKYANYQLKQVIVPMQTIKRDDLSSIINYNRNKFANPRGDYEFPFVGDYFVEEGDEIRTYGAFFTGLFKNLYLHVDVLKEIVQSEAIVNYRQVVEEIFRIINGAAGEFWGFRLVGATGRLNTTGLATMKVTDDKLAQYTSNEGNIFTFDYYAADSLLQSINFRPMLSNAQAIRTIYAQTNLADRKRSVALVDQNPLLEYKFKDRLFKTNKEKNTDDTTFRDSTFKTSMEALQSINPPDTSVFQISTLDKNKKPIKYRLAIPPTDANVLTLMVEDEDRGHNPRYCGIMPNIQAEFTIQGIAGIRTFAMFRVRGLPEPYSEENIIFRVINVNDTIESGQWTTNIVAGILPLQNYFRSKLGLPLKLLKSEKK